MRLTCKSLYVISVLALGGCTTECDLHSRMSRAVRPTTDELQQTLFAHIGHVTTLDGRYEICIQRLVCTGMLQPRGQTHLHLFTPRGNLARSYSYPDPDSIPLWCEEGRVYVFGFVGIGGIPIDPAIAGRFANDEFPKGNVIDFSLGLDRAVITREKRYGSSGGIEHEVWP